MSLVTFPPALINFDGERLDFVFHAGAPNSRKIIVLGHGVTGHKDRPFLVEIAEGLAARGFNVVRCSWSGNGESEGEFSASNITKEVRDLDAIIGTLKTAGYRIAYAGHSMGGAVGVRRAAHDQRIEWLISLAGIVHTWSFAQSAFGHLTPGEGLMFDKPGLVLPQAYMDDLQAIGSLIDEVDQIKVPWLLIHGTNDPVVPQQDSRDAYARATGDKTYVELPGIDHLFAPNAIPKVVDTVADWCRDRFEK
ncbi:MAG: alpha/beta hydrolase [Synoicihabitans sp.]